MVNSKKQYYFSFNHKLFYRVSLTYFAKQSDEGLISFANSLAKEINFVVLSVSIRVLPCLM